MTQIIDNTQVPKMGLCHYCGMKKDVYDVDPLIIYKDNCKGLFICKECAIYASKIDDRVDKIVYDVTGTVLYSKKEMIKLKEELKILKAERLARPEFGRWWKHPLD